jgi:DNA invertase Pin-like site-specific DNA recombinase
MSRAIYVRTSTDDNDGAAQLHELRQWCEKEGWSNVKEYIDKGESGIKESRPQWDQLRAEVTRGRVTELVCTELSRLGRSVVNVILALDDFYRAGCRVILLRQGLDYGTAVGRLVATILAAVAQLEREQTKERIRAGVRRAQNEGTRSGKPIGRPRANITKEIVNEALWLKKKRYDWPWSQVAKYLGVSETSLRRARQKPSEELPSETTENQPLTSAQK